MASQTPTIAFFGATGGVTNSVLVHALRAGRKVVCLVRKPSKLNEQLAAQGISPGVLASQLTTVTGNALDIAAVKSTVTANNAPDYLVPHIVSGLGAAPQMPWSWRKPTAFAIIDQPTLCGDAAKVLVKALTELLTEQPALIQCKPKLTFVSTTGISDGPEDVPVGLQTMYHSLLAVPHRDKKIMEATFRDNLAGRAGEVVFGGVIGMRPTLLAGAAKADEGKGVDKLRVGREGAPTKGFLVHRADVGHWMWVNVVGDNEKRQAWENDMVTLTL